jgi:hypothetical protein
MLDDTKESLPIAKLDPINCQWPSDESTSMYVISCIWMNQWNQSHKCLDKFPSAMPVINTLYAWGVILQVNSKDWGAEARHRCVEKCLLAHWEIYYLGGQITYGTCNITCINTSESRTQQTIIDCIRYKLGRDLRGNLDSLATDWCSINGDNVGTDSSRCTTLVCALDRPCVAAQLLLIWGLRDWTKFDQFVGKEVFN